MENRTTFVIAHRIQTVMHSGVFAINDMMRSSSALNPERQQT